METGGKRAGRPQKNIDPNGSGDLLSYASNHIADSYEDFSGDDSLTGMASGGPVVGGGGDFSSRGGAGEGEGAALPEQSDQAILDALWARAHAPGVPAAAQIQALTKFSQIRERMAQGSGPEDIPGELAAFIAQVRERRTLAPCDNPL